MSGVLKMDKAWMVLLGDITLTCVWMRARIWEGDESSNGLIDQDLSEEKRETR